MTDDGLQFTNGESALREVEADPFWAAVRRRHPDIDVVVLPGPPSELEPTQAPPGEPLTETQAIELTDADLAEIWTALLGDAEPSLQQQRWLPGTTPDVVRRESTWTRDGIDPVLAIGLVERAADALAPAGWSVFTPPDGLPRAMAHRDAERGRMELQLVLVPHQDRIVLRLRSAELSVGSSAAHSLRASS